MCTVSRYEIGSNFVDASLSIYKMCEEKDEFGELSVWEKIKRVCNFFTSLGCAGNSAVALHDDRYYNKIDAGLNVVSLVDIGIETYQDVVDEEKRDTGGFLKLVARIVRVACSVLTLLPLPQPLPGIFSIVKTTAVYTCQFHTLFWNPFFIDPRTDSSLPFSEKDEKQFCQWVACFKSAQAYLCCITQRFIRRPVAYPDRDIHVDFGSIEDLRQRNVTQVMIIGKMYSLMEFSEASSEKVIQAERRYQMCRKLYSTFIRFRGGLKKCIDNDVFSEVSFRLLRNYSLSIKCCPITQRGIRNLSFPINSTNVFYEKAALFNQLEKNKNKMPPHWPSGLPFNQESIVVSGKVCEKYESDIREVFTEIQASITVIDQSTPSLKDRFQYYCSYYYFHK